MDRFLAASALAMAISWSWTARAACVSEMQCDSAGVCTQVEICDETIDVVHATPGAMTSIPGETDPMAATQAAASATDGNCRQVDICGTMTLVCD